VEGQWWEMSVVDGEWGDSGGRCLLLMVSGGTMVGDFKLILIVIVIITVVVVIGGILGIWC